jgi:hypothetical protein
MMYCAVGDSGTLCSRSVLALYFHPQIASGTFHDLAHRDFCGDASQAWTLAQGRQKPEGFLLTGRVDG